MPSFAKTFVAVASLLSLAQAYTPLKGDPTWGPLQSPDLSSKVVRGEKFNITWDPENHPTQSVTVSLVLCKGPGSNCKLEPDAIATALPASQKSFEWIVPCTLAAGEASTATGYGMAIIVDQTGEYQYSTQFSIQEGSTCASADPSATVPLSTFSTVSLPPSTSSESSHSAKSSSESATSSSSTSVAGMTTTAATPTRSVAAASSTTPSTTSPTNGAVAKATNAAGALVAVGLAILAI